MEGVRTGGARPSAGPGLGGHQRARCRGVFYSIIICRFISMYQIISLFLIKRTNFDLNKKILEVIRLGLLT